MTRDERRRPLLAAPNITSHQNDVENDRTDDDEYRDDVEDFFTNRHKQMAKKHGLNDSDSDDDFEDEPETKEYNVLNIHSSDSEDEDFDMLYQENPELNEDEERGDWGGKRRNWYGGDTHEYEIMEREEREEILQDEEEEAIRLRKKALERARPEDYIQDDEDDLEDENDHEEGQQLETDPSVLDTNVPAPELNLLAKEFQLSFAQLSELKDKSHMDEKDRINYQLLALFVSNIALYFSIRTDPDCVGVDLRTHPVLARIVQIRSLLRNAKSVPRKQLANGSVLKEPGNGEREDSNEVKVAEVNQSEHQDENNGANGREAQQKQHKQKRRKKKKTTKDKGAIAADEAKVLSLLQPFNSEGTEKDQAIRERKRRKLNKIVGAMERERKNNDANRMASADLDVVREEVREAKTRTDYQGRGTQEREGVDTTDLIDDDEVMRKMLAKREKKEARKARKAADSTPHVYTFKDEVGPDGKRKASTQVIKNRGLTRYRPRDKKTPRTKNRLAYGKAVIRRKGAVREYTGSHGGSYGGEASGINMSARKSSIL